MKIQRGFTLVEIMAAFALMALALTLCLSIASRAYRQVADADKRASAVQWTQTLMAQADEQPLAIGLSEGTTSDGAFHWRREITLYQDPDGVIIERPGVSGLLRIRLQVAWGDGGPTETVGIDTLRAPDPPTPMDLP